MKFVDSHVNAERRFSLGREVESGRFYLAIPVANRLADYEEYYEINFTMYNSYPGNLVVVAEFAEQCRARANDKLLLVQPGGDRGAA